MQGSCVLADEGADKIGYVHVGFGTLGGVISACKDDY